MTVDEMEAAGFEVLVGIGMATAKRDGISVHLSEWPVGSGMYCLVKKKMRKYNVARLEKAVAGLLMRKQVDAEKRRQARLARMHRAYETMPEKRGVVIRPTKAKARSCGKRVFRSLVEAVEAKNLTLRLGDSDKKPTSAYQCPDCGLFHLTSKPG